MARAAIGREDEPYVAPQGTLSSSVASRSSMAEDVPALLERLSSEPLTGLHFICAHARNRAVPALVALRASLRDRTRAAADMGHSAEYTSEALKSSLPQAMEALKKATEAVRRTREVISEKNGRSAVPVVSSR